MPQQRFDLIVFDWDGTLMDSTPTIVQCIQAACADLQLPIPPASAAAHVIGLGLKDALQMAVPSLAVADYPKLAERYRFHFLTRDHALTLFDGAYTMLETLKKQGYYLAVATGKTRVGLDRALVATGLRDFFDITRCADETHSKPHPAMLLEINRHAGLDMTRTLMIGDTTHDLQMALNAGAHGLAVAYGAHPPEPLLALNPVYCAKNVAELDAWLQQHA